MIGKQAIPRGDSQQLAGYLMKHEKNEEVRQFDITGCASRDVAGAMQEMDDIAAFTKCGNFVFHMSFRTPPNLALTDAEKFYAIKIYEQALGLEGHQRVSVIHKNGQHEHVHIVWNRINVETGAAKRMSFSKLRLLAASRILEYDLGHPFTQSQDFNHKRVCAILKELGRDDVAAWMDHERDPDKIIKPANSHAQEQQAKRLKVDLVLVKNDLNQVWQQTDGGKAFLNAIEEKGYMLARGDRRDIVVLDWNGGVHNPAKMIDGVRVAQIRERFADLSVSTLPTVGEARTMQRQKAKAADQRHQETGLHQAAREKARYAALEVMQQMRLERMEQDIEADFKAIEARMLEQLPHPAPDPKLSAQEQQKREADYQATRAKKLHQLAEEKLQRLNAFRLKDYDQAEQERRDLAEDIKIMRGRMTEESQPLGGRMVNAQTDERPFPLNNVPTDAKATADSAVAFAIRHISEQYSVFPERDLRAVALKFAGGKITDDAITAVLPRHGTIADNINSRRMITTHALQAEENYIAERVRSGRGKLTPAGVSPLLQKGDLNDEQWQVTQGLLNSRDRVQLVEGAAGVGKTTLLSVHRAGMDLAGRPVTYLATLATAVRDLNSAGFDAKTVAYFLHNEEMQKATAGHCVVVDECSMLGHRDAVKLFSLVEKHDLKLIFSGDPMQHGSVSRGSFIRVLKEYGGVSSYRLSQIMRQVDPAYRAAVVKLSQGETVAGFEAIKNMGWVQEQPDDDARYPALAAEYVQAINEGKSCLVVSPTHSEAGFITAEIRQQLRAAGKIGQEEHELSRLINTNASEAARRMQSIYKAGDVLVFHEATGKFERGQQVTVTDPALVPTREAESFNLFRQEKMSLATGDKIRFIATLDLEDGSTLRNGDTHFIEKISDDSITLDSGQEVPRDARLFRPAWVETSFGSQGQTVDKVIIGMGAESLGAMNQEQIYVSASRGRESVTIYTDDLERLEKAIARSSMKLAALDVQDRTHRIETPAAEEKIDPIPDHHFQDGDPGDDLDI